LNKSFGTQVKAKQYTEIWAKIIDALLDDFHKFVGQDFQREPEFDLEIKYPHSPSFSRWM
jgi:hypothetical protein